jgi:hypothetical protein
MPQSGQHSTFRKRTTGAAAEWARFHLFVPQLSMIALCVIQNVYVVRLGRGILPHSTGSAAAAAALIKEFDQWKVSDRS